MSSAAVAKAPRGRSLSAAKKASPRKKSPSSPRGESKGKKKNISKASAKTSKKTSKASPPNLPDSPQTTVGGATSAIGSNFVFSLDSPRSSSALEPAGGLYDRAGTPRLVSTTVTTSAKDENGEFTKVLSKYTIQHPQMGVGWVVPQLPKLSLLPQPSVRFIGQVGEENRATGVPASSGSVPASARPGDNKGTTTYYVQSGAAKADGGPPPVLLRSQSPGLSPRLQFLSSRALASRTAGADDEDASVERQSSALRRDLRKEELLKDVYPTARAVNFLSEAINPYCVLDVVRQYPFLRKNAW